MRRLARCLLAALLASAFAAPVLANPPPVKAPPVVTSLPTLTFVPTVWEVSISGHAPIRHPVPNPPTLPTVADAKEYALEQLGSVQFACLDSIAQGESKWNPYAWNKRGSGAYGIPQAWPATKMASAGADWRTNPVTQVRWMIAYVNAKYGSACGGAAYRAVHGRY